MSFWECDTCDRQFVNEHAACDRSYPTSAAAREHMDRKNHWRLNWCQPCSKGFQNANNLRMHLNSRIHRTDGVACMFCKKQLATASGVAHHLEKNSCPMARNVNRKSIHQYMQEKDTAGLYTKKLLTWKDETSSQMNATIRTWNGSGYECYLCRREFSKLQGLNQHLGSPVHQQPIYHCPKNTCCKEFRHLAGLFNHFESESCGYIRFEHVQNSVNGLLTGRRLLMVC
ncbi:hypothetical protein EJ08DRAFT_668985 [Tothia fuscella]|uniref:C2H2-type domain-containing protein n=1 Tax=Tothia fuscella TaxID=1048955 RepID=A0A9P4U0B7_9PEZI|nr:hypothetical protein EJ08DRAFT_668985 [Tothia fuscella]